MMKKCVIYFLVISSISMYGYGAESRPLSDRVKTALRVEAIPESDWEKLASFTEDLDFPQNLTQRMLVYGCITNRDDLVRLSLKKGINPFLIVPECFLLAVKFGGKRVFRALFSQIEALNELKKEEEPLALAILGGNSSIVKELFYKGFPLTMISVEAFIETKNKFSEKSEHVSKALKKIEETLSLDSRFANFYSIALERVKSSYESSDDEDQEAAQAGVDIDCCLSTYESGEDSTT